MHKNIFLRQILFLAILAGLLFPAVHVFAIPSLPSSAKSEVTAFDLIVAMNTLRASYGLPALIEDPVIDAVAQSTAEFMAARNMATHIGNVSGRLASAGYGGGSKVWGTENFAIGYYTIDELMAVWADEAHMLPATIPAYCNVGAGATKASNGMNYYVLQAAYTSDKACGSYTSVGGATTNPTGSTSGGRAGGVSQLIVPVKIATPDADGKITHMVEAGQSFWSIAVAYKLTVKDLQLWNNLPQESTLRIGQKLFIPGPNTRGFTTPTPVGVVQTVMPAADGKVVHTVQPYQTLSTIAQAYGVILDNLLTLNAITIDAPLQIGQKLVVRPSNITPSPTPRPLTPLEKLTPASDGKYYHSVKSGENLVWIADLYKVSLKDLMDWNGLKAASVLQPNQKLLLQVTPPAGATATPDAASATPSATRVSATLTPTRLPSQTATLPASSTPVETPDPSSTEPAFPWMILAGVIATGVIMITFLSRKK